MKRILIQLLLLSTLFSGAAFAWDNHPEAILDVDHDSIALDLLSSTDQNSTDNNNETHNSDHCCHATAHLMAMVLQHTPPTISNDGDDFLTSSKTPVLRYIAPPLHPPRS